MKEKKMKMSSSSGGGAVYGIGMIGALIYFIQNSNGLADLLLGVLKSIVWPGVLVYRALELLNL